MNRDFVEMLSELSASSAEFLVVGAHALAAHGLLRATGDLDIWVRADEKNAPRVLEALRRFGAPLSDLSLDDLSKPGTVFQIGTAPARIDILTGVSGLYFDEAWPRRMTVKIGELSVAVIGREDLIRNKRATGRPQDLLDADRLERHRE
ncbi:MAG: nucleotidyltransferase [Acidithiobacillales bacterium]